MRPSLTINCPNLGASTRLKSLVFLGICALASLCVLANNHADPDLWGHVQFGRDALRDGHIHTTTTYSFTANGYRWINHENLSELALAFTYDQLGKAGMIVGKLLLAGLLILLIVRSAIVKRVSPVAVGIILFLVCDRLAFHWHFRPQIASFVFCGMVLFWLERCFRNWTSFIEGETEASRIHSELRWLWLLPIVFFFWANSHGGFVAGLCIYTAFLVGKTIEVRVYRKEAFFGLSRRFGLMAATALAATLINPYGPNLHFWLLQSLGEPRPEIRDWHSIDLTTMFGFQFLVVVGVSCASILFCGRKRDWTKILILCLVGWQAYAHVRHAAFFAILVGFWIPDYLDGLTRAWGAKLRVKQNSSTPVSWSPWFQCGLASFACLMLTTIVYRCSDITVDRSSFPVSAVEYMAENKISGKLVVTYNWAQYAIGVFGGEHDDMPVCPVAFDGRFRTCYPQQIVDMHFDFVIGDQGPGTRNRSIESGPPNDKRVLDFGNPELVLISRRQKPSVEVMESLTNEWCLIYQDRLAQVWGRKSIFDSNQNERFVAPHRRRISDLPQSGFVSWPAFPKSDSQIGQRRRTAKPEQAPKRAPASKPDRVAQALYGHDK